MEIKNNPISPNHYKFVGVEVIDITKHMSFCAGNAVKYLARAGRKGDSIEDLKKALVYIDWAIDAPSSVAMPQKDDVKTLTDQLPAGQAAAIFLLCGEPADKDRKKNLKLAREHVRNSIAIGGTLRDILGACYV